MGSLKTSDGRETTDKDRPSSVLKEGATSEQDKLNKPYLNAGMLAWIIMDNNYILNLFFFWYEQEVVLIYVNYFFSPGQNIHHLQRVWQEEGGILCRKTKSCYQGN